MENKLSELDLTIIENWLNNYVDRTEEKRGGSFSPENFKHISSLAIVMLIQKFRIGNVVDIFNDVLNSVNDKEKDG